MTFGIDVGVDMTEAVTDMLDLQNSDFLHIRSGWGEHALHYAAANHAFTKEAWAAVQTVLDLELSTVRLNTSSMAHSSARM